MISETHTKLTIVAAAQIRFPISGGTEQRRPRPPKRLLAFFTAQINNDHTRKAYL